MHITRCCDDVIWETKNGLKNVRQIETNQEKKTDSLKYSAREMAVA